MITKELLQQMAITAFGSTYQEEIQNIYQGGADNGLYGKLEKEYHAAKTELTDMLSKDLVKTLLEYEETARKVREFSASYGFCAGLMCGFKQYFTPDCANDGGFSQYVANEIAQMPNMERHTENYANIKRCHNLYETLIKDGNMAVRHHMVSISCAWQQRCRSASISGFYCGYRGAMGILDEIMPLGAGSIRIINKLVTMEHFWGYIMSYSEIERQNTKKIEKKEKQDSRN